MSLNHNTVSLNHDTVSSNTVTTDSICAVHMTVEANFGTRATGLAPRQQLPLRSGEVRCSSLQADRLRCSAAATRDLLLLDRLG